VTLDDLQAAILATEPRDFVIHRLFDDGCWLFEQAALVAPGSTYAQMKADIANLLGIMPRGIAVVGSGKYGFSLSPTKAFRPFDAATSDIDVLLASRPIFDEAWSELRTAYYAGYGQYKRQHADQIFARCLVLQGSESYKSVYLRDLALQLSQLNAVVNSHVRLGLENPAKYRIYADWDDAVNYHSHGMGVLKRKLSDGHAE